MQHDYWRVFSPILTLAGWFGIGFNTEAQNVQTLLNWDARWRYNESGAELGTDWKEFSYPLETAAPWIGSRSGLLAFEDTPSVYGVHAPIRTLLTVSTVVTTYYFRTTFSFTGSTSNLSLIASNLLDDGAAFYLNGTEVGRLRVPAEANAATFATGPSQEGRVEPVLITKLTALRQGDNVMAVELHQNANNSSDVAFGMKLLAIESTRLRITNEPQDQFVYEGGSLALSVGVEGGPVNYRWFRVPFTTPIVGATGPTLTIASSSAIGTGGGYYVIATNTVNAVTSRVAKVVVIHDTSGPLAIEANGDHITFRNRGAKTLVITFNEGLTHPNDTNPANYAVYAGTNFNTRLTFTNALYNFSTMPRVYLFMNDPRWVWGSNYFVVLNNVADGRGNLIAPNTRVPVCWPASGGGPALPCSRLPSEPPPGQLLLSIKRQGSNAAVVSWPSAFGGYFLQYKSDFEPSFTWITVSDQTNPYTSTLGDGPRLFRLRKP